MGSWSLPRHSVCNTIHEESMKMFWPRSFLPSGRQIDLRSEPVTDLRIGKKVFGRGGVITELFPQLPDKSAEILQLMAVFRSPDCCQNAVVRKDRKSTR